MFDKLIEKVKAQPKTIVFTEGTDARILSAASRLLAEGLMGVVLVGNVDEVKASTPYTGINRNSPNTSFRNLNTTEVKS